MTEHPLFPLLGEPLSLDLVNTCIRRNACEVDLLDAPPALAAWLAAEAHRLPWSGPVSAADLRSVWTLRDAVRLLLATEQPDLRMAVRAAELVTAALAAGARPPRLVWTTNGPQVRRSNVGQRARLLHALAADAVGIMDGPDADLLRTCEHPGCVLRFLARNPRRRWCSAGCGNRARVARHYARHRTRPSPDKRIARQT